MNQKRIDYEIILLLLKKSSHGREISKELKVPLSSIQRAISGLEKENVIEYKKIGKNKAYSIKKHLPARIYVYNAEHYKLLKIIETYKKLGPFFEDLIKRYPDKMIVLFGSFARFAAKIDSDVDIYIETTNPSIKKEIEGTYSMASVKIGKFDKNDLLIKEIIDNHAIIRGIEKFYEKTGFFK